MARHRMLKETVLKAIETRYNGHRFRSRTEARWAVLLDHLGVKYEYEAEGFELDDGVRYLPDFYLPAEDCFLEIKGAEPTEEDWAKAGALAFASQKFVNILSGPPGKHRMDFARPKKPASDDLVAWVNLCPDEEVFKRCLFDLDRFAMPPELQSPAVARGVRHNTHWRTRSDDNASTYQLDFDDASGRLVLWKTHWMPGYNADGLEDPYHHRISEAQVMGSPDGFLGWFDEVRFSPAFYAAVDAAKSARFEFGESGAG